MQCNRSSLAKVCLAGLLAMSLLGCSAAHETASSCTSGSCAMRQPATQSATATTAAAPLPGFANTLCPVEQDAIDPTIFITYEGKKIGFCCTDCREKFLLNPDKYLASMK